MYMLGLTVLGVVLTVTIVFALAAYLIDKGEERVEEREVASLGSITPDEEHSRQGE